MNLYAMLGNDPANAIDAFGLLLDLFSRPGNVTYKQVPALEDPIDLADCTPNWPSSVVSITSPDERGNSLLELTGQFSATIRYVNEGDLDKPPASNTGRYRTTRAHELNHVALSGQQWNEFAEYANKLAQMTWTCNCARWAKAAVEFRHAIMEWQSSLDNVNFDIEEYGNQEAVLIKLRLEQKTLEQGLDQARKSLQQLMDTIHTKTNCEIPN